MKDKKLRPNHQEDKKHVGTHIVADFWECEFKENAEVLRKLLVKAAKISNATVLNSMAHQFKENHGSTAMVLLAESHISAHTWPELDYIAIDVFTCGQTMKPAEAINYLKEHLKPKKVNKRNIRRGESVKSGLLYRGINPGISFTKKI